MAKTTPGSNILMLAGRQVAGTSGADVLVGTTATDVFMAADGGDDDLSGGVGDDSFFFGAALTGADRIDGGAGADTVRLQGSYASGVTLGETTLAGIETLALLSGTDTQFGASGIERFGYALTSADGNVAAGRRLTIDAAGLQPDEALAFNGAAERDREFTILAGFGDDRLTGGGGSDGFLFGSGARGGRARFTADDVVDGGVGSNDQIALRGDYGTRITMTATTMTNVETLALLSAYDTRFGPAATSYRYDLKSHDANLAAGQQLLVVANELRADEYVSFDGSAETNGTFRFSGGAGNDTFVGGSGADFIFGNLGADRLTGGGGNDVFVYQSVKDSTSMARDQILDFTVGDRINLALIDADASPAGIANEAFRFIGTAAFSLLAGELRATLANGAWTVEGDVDGDGTADFSLLVTTIDGHALTVSDFVL